MIKAVGGVESHADLFHHAAGAEILFSGEGDERIELQISECVCSHGACTFRCEALSPGVCCQAPADFYAGCEVSFEIRNRKTDETYETVVRLEFDGAQSEASLREGSVDSVNDAVAVFLRQGIGEELHDTQIGVDLSEGLAVGVLPAAQDKP